MFPKFVEHLKKTFSRQFSNFAIYFVIVSSTISITMKLAHSNEKKKKSVYITFIVLYNKRLYIIRLLFRKIFLRCDEIGKYLLDRDNFHFSKTSFFSI